jgi:hypothetical protein
LIFTALEGVSNEISDSPDKIDLLTKVMHAVIFPFRAAIPAHPWQRACSPHFSIAEINPHLPSFLRYPFFGRCVTVAIAEVSPAFFGDIQYIETKGVR